MGVEVFDGVVPLGPKLVVPPASVTEMPEAQARELVKAVDACSLERKLAVSFIRWKADAFRARGDTLVAVAIDELADDLASSKHVNR